MEKAMSGRAWGGPHSIHIMCEGAFGSVAAILRIPGAIFGRRARPHVVGRVAEAVLIKQIRAALQQVVELGDGVHVALYGFPTTGQV